MKFGTDLFRAVVYNAANLKWNCICCSRSMGCSSVRDDQGEPAMKLRLLVAFVLLSTAMLVGQTFRGTILGTVTDPSGAVVAGAGGQEEKVATGAGGSAV